MAALAPVPDLGAVVVLDDDDEALQEERSPTWHARDVAFERARRCGAHAYVVSPAPSVQVSNEVPGAFAPAHAFEVEGWPRVDVVDQRELPPGSGLLSEPLVDAVRATVERGVLAVIVQNRRGGVRLLRCDACHELTRWDANGRPLWDHDTPADIELKPTFCIHCGGMRLRVLSGGVQRLANHLALRLAGHDVAVVDAAVPTAPEAAVLVGTEAVLHRREVRRRRPGLVAFVDFDAELFAARYRASEQALWLIVRAAHVMAAAPRHETRVLLQTHQPDHPVVVAAREGCPEVFLVEEARRRVSYDLPPHSALAHVRADDPVVDAVHAALSETHWSQRGVGADRTEGQLLVRAPDADVLAEALEVGLGAARAVGTARVVVDPPRI